MFKPLLRTIPSLTGNFTLGCKITDIERISEDIFSGYCREAELKPLQDNLFNKYIHIGLLDNLYEYDISRYYQQYSAVFYKSNFNFNKEDYQKLDLTHNQNYIRNLDYEFGCKRISYQSNNYEYEFFAPIYIDNSDDLPDYFEIEITFNKYFSKKLRIKINENVKKNYLYKYIKRYTDKLDETVIFYNENLNSLIYYGINVQNGGFVKIKDYTNLFLFKEQSTVNLFNKSINKGFENNKLAIKQIIPFSFLFNIEDLLTSNEYNKCKFYKIQKITGNYIKNGKPIQFYDFLFNHNMYDDDLKESLLSLYKYENKISTIYNFWKLQLSSDDDIYYTNLNHIFTNNKTYGKIFNVINNYNNLLKVDNGVAELEGDEITFYDQLNSKNLLDIDSFFTQNRWHKCINNYSYINGILYNLNNIFINKNLINIDYFNIFILPNYTIYDKQSYSKLLYTKNVIDFSKDNIESNVKNIYVDLNCIINNKQSNFININKHPDTTYYSLAYLSNYVSFKLSNYLNTDIPQYLLCNNLKNNYIIWENDLSLSNIEVDAFIYQKINECVNNIAIDGYVKINTIYNYKNIAEYIETHQCNNIYFYNIYSNKIENLEKYINKELLYSFDQIDIYIRYKFLDIYIFLEELGKLNLDDDVLCQLESYLDINNSNLTLYEYVTDNKINNNYIFKKSISKDNRIYIDNYKFDYKSENIKSYARVSNEGIFNLINNDHENDNWVCQTPIINSLSLNIYYKSTEIHDKNILYPNFNDNSNVPIIDDHEVKLYKEIFTQPITKNEINNIKQSNYTYYLYSPENEFSIDTFKEKFAYEENSFISTQQDYLFLKKLYNNEKRNDEEISHQKKLIELGNICLKEEINGSYEYLPIPDDGDYDDTKIVYVDDLSNKYLNMVEMTQYIIDNIISNKANLYILNDNIIELFNIIFEIDLNDFSQFMDNKDNFGYQIKINSLNTYLDNIFETLNRYGVFSNLSRTEIIDQKSLYKDIRKKYINKDDCEVLLDKIKNIFHNYIIEKCNILRECENCKYVLINPNRIDFFIENVYNGCYNKNCSLYDNHDNYVKIFENFIFNQLGIQLYERVLSDNLMFYNDKLNEDFIKHQHGEDNNSLIYKYNGKTYAFIILFKNVSNTNFTFNTDNYIFNMIKYNDSITPFTVSDYGFDRSLKKLSKYFKNNIFSDYLDILSSLGIYNIYTAPKLFKLNINYAPKISKFNENDYEDSIFSAIEELEDYNIYELERISHNSKLNLYRYINYISPILLPTNNIKAYELKYKRDSYIGYGVDNIYFNKSIDILTYGKVKCFYNDKLPHINDQQYDEIADYEYKHFNDNSFYILEPYFEININKHLTYDEIIEYEKEKVILEYFTKYVNKYIHNFNLDKNQILFLFNKYKIEYHSTPVVLTYLRDKKLYSLKYIFTLI